MSKQRLRWILQVGESVNDISILGRTAVSGVVYNRDGVGNNLVMQLPADLSVKGEGGLLAAGLLDDDLFLVHGVGGIGELT